MGLEVYRTRRTRLAWKRQWTRVSVIAAHAPKGPPEGPDGAALLIDFEIEAAGGGWTRISVSVAPADFGRLMTGMMRVDRAITHAAFVATRQQARGRVA